MKKKSHAMYIPDISTDVTLFAMKWQHSIQKHFLVPWGNNFEKKILTYCVKNLIFWWTFIPFLFIQLSNTHQKAIDIGKEKKNENAK